MLIKNGVRVKFEGGKTGKIIDYCRESISYKVEFWDEETYELKIRMGIRFKDIESILLKTKKEFSDTRHVRPYMEDNWLNPNILDKHFGIVSQETVIDMDIYEQWINEYMFWERSKEFDITKYYPSPTTIYTARRGYGYRRYGAINTEKAIMPAIKFMQINGDHITAVWKDGTHTVIKRNEDDSYDLEKAVLYLILKRLCNNKKSTMDKYIEMFFKNCNIKDAKPEKKTEVFFDDTEDRSWSVIKETELGDNSDYQIYSLSWYPYEDVFVDDDISEAVDEFVDKTIYEIFEYFRKHAMDEAYTHLYFKDDKHKRYFEILAHDSNQHWIDTDEDQITIDEYLKEDDDNDEE